MDKQLNEIINIEDFIKLKNPKKYDFTNEKTSKNYYEKTDYEKFFAYMSVRMKNRFDQNEKYDLFNKAYKKDIKMIEKYGNIIDPDSYSLLLQSIYKQLWEDNPICRRAKRKIQGETLNSVNTILNVYYFYIEKRIDKERKEIQIREKMKTKKGYTQPTSIKYILSNYLVNGRNSKVISELIRKRDFNNFLNIYHTIGNFMPVPKGCNGPRGTHNVKDYLDLTLLNIYEYYKDSKIEHIYNIVGEEKADIYKKWLDSYKINNKGWHNFIEKNYLEDFVDKNSKDEYPIELWKNHFKQWEEWKKVKNKKNSNKSIHPLSEKQCEEYYKTASKRILLRGKTLVDKIKE